MIDNLAGIIAPITIPFLPGEQVALEELRANVRRYGETPLTGLFVVGSNGENKSLSYTEKLQVCEPVVQAKADHQVVIAGTGHESTRQTITLSKEMTRLGVQAVAILAPSYFRQRLTDEALIRYYSDVAEALTVPVYLYNAPGFTVVGLSVKVIEKLASIPTSPGSRTPLLGVSSSTWYSAILASKYSLGR